MVLGKGRSARVSPCKWPSSTRPRRNSTPPNRWGRTVTPGQLPTSRCTESPGGWEGTAIESRLDERQDVAGRVSEPGNGSHLGRSMDALRIRPRLRVVLELHAARGQLIHSPFDVVDHKIQDGEYRRGVVRLRVDQDIHSIGDADPEAGRYVGTFNTEGSVSNIESQRRSLELLGLGHVVHGETG